MKNQADSGALRTLPADEAAGGVSGAQTEKSCENAGAEKGKRQFAPDVLRVIAMLFIILHHLLTGNIGFSQAQQGESGALYYVSSFLDGFFVIGVNIFFLLSGYLKINLRLSKIISLLLKIFVIGSLSVCIAAACGTEEYGGAWDIILSCLTFAFEHWFVYVYIGICLLSPLLNLFAEKLGGKAGYFVGISLFLLCIVAFGADYIYAADDGGSLPRVSLLGTNAGYSILWGCALYLFGRLISLHGFAFRRRARFWALSFVVCSLVLGGVTAGLIALGQGAAAWWFIYCYNNPLQLFSAVSLLCICLHIRGGRGAFSAAVSFAAKHSFTAYIIHSDNPLFSPYRAFLLDCVSGKFWAQILLLLPNALIIFALGIAVSFVYDFTLGRILGRFSRFAERVCLAAGRKVCGAIGRVFGGAKGDTKDR